MGKYGLQRASSGAKEEETVRTTHTLPPRLACYVVSVRDFNCQSGKTCVKPSRSNWPSGSAREKRLIGGGSRAAARWLHYSTRI